MFAVNASCSDSADAVGNEGEASAFLMPFEFVHQDNSLQIGPNHSNAKKRQQSTASFLYSKTASFVQNQKDLMRAAIKAYSLDSSLRPLPKPDSSNQSDLNVVTTVGNDSLEDYSMMADSATPANDIITINVSGMRYQTYIRTLERYPETLLGSEVRRRPFFVPAMNEYFFDRHRTTFDSILYFYQCGGTIKRPGHVNLETFLEELEFFQFPDHLMMKVWESEGYCQPKERARPENRLQRIIWELCEHPDSSIFARIFAFFSVFVISISTATFCLETLPMYESLKDNFDNPFYVIETVCIAWFTFEFVIRILSCPNKCKFCTSFLNIVDFVAIIPFYVNLIFEISDGGALSFAVLRVLRLVRVFRIFKLSRHSRGLQILGMTFKASIRELCLLLFFLGITVILFSSAVYFLEMGYKSTKFTSIPQGFWYAIVTMTTVGYGDIVPTGPYGKLLGSCCAVIGVLVIALPVPVIVENFKHFYRQDVRVAHIHKIAASKNSNDAKVDGACDFAFSEDSEEK